MTRTEKFFKHLRMQPQKIPRRAQDLVPVDQVWDDGVFRFGNFYSRSYAFDEVNFLGLPERRKREILGEYTDILMNAGVRGFAQITVARTRSEKQDTDTQVVPLVGDELDRFRREINQAAASGMKRRGKFDYSRFLTVAVSESSQNSQTDTFAAVDEDLENRFKKLGSECKAMSTKERLAMLHDFFRPQDKGQLNESRIKDAVEENGSIRDLICPDSFHVHLDRLRIGKRYARVMHLSEVPGAVNDDFIDKLMSGNQDMILSVSFKPVPQGESIQRANQQYTGVMSTAYRHSQQQTAAGNFTAEIPYHLQEQRDALLYLLDKLEHDNQIEILASVKLMIITDTREELEQETKLIQAVAAGMNCKVSTMRTEQAAAMADVLPVGSWQAYAIRSYLSGSVCGFHPFRTHEILDRHGIYLGRNAITRTPIILDQSLLLNGGGFVLGMSGSGKSVFIKLLISNKLMLTNDQILILDPEGEYWPLIQALCGDDAALVRLHADGNHYLNPMDNSGAVIDSELVSTKSDLILSLVKDMDPDNVTSYDNSIMDRCITAVYEEAGKTGTVPTLTTLREKLMEQPEPQAKAIALTLELYTVGSMDIFGHESTVDLSKRVIVFNTHGLAENLRSPALKIITSTILNRTNANDAQGKRTHIFLDEFHWLFEDEHAAKFFASAWKQFRKRNGYPTAITQNVTQLLQHKEAQIMLSNSALLVMLCQSSADRLTLSKELLIPNDLLQYVTDSEPGCGLIKCGRKLVPFVNRFPANTELYRLITTRPGEGAFSDGQV